MIPPMPSRLGVCSWSLQPTSAADLATRVRDVGLGVVQVALDPLRTGAWDPAVFMATMSAANITVVSGMMATVGEDYATLESIRQTGGVRPDATWEQNLAAAEANADLARRLRLPLVTLHAGFIPEHAGPERTTLIARLRRLVDVFAARGVNLAFETGQESAACLEQALIELDRPAAGVNFDPANMILYGMGDPVDALRRLAPRVRQIHLKDARAAVVPGTWGDEVRAGTGQVDWPAFFGVWREQRLEVDVLIEREAGTERPADIRAARELAERLWQGHA